MENRRAWGRLHTIVLFLFYLMNINHTLNTKDSICDTNVEKEILVIEEAEILTNEEVEKLDRMTKESIRQGTARLVPL